MGSKRTNLERLKADLLTDEQAIIALVAAREATWNAGDTEAFAGVRTHTTVSQVRMIGRDAALADVEYRLAGGRAEAVRRANMVFVLRKDASRWRIAAIRSIPA